MSRPYWHSAFIHIFEAQFEHRTVLVASNTSTLYYSNKVNIIFRGWCDLYSVTYSFNPIMKPCYICQIRVSRWCNLTRILNNIVSYGILRTHICGPRTLARPRQDALNFNKESNGALGVQNFGVSLVGQPKFCGFGQTPWQICTICLFVQPDLQCSAPANTIETTVLVVVWST